MEDMAIRIKDEQGKGIIIGIIKEKVFYTTREKSKHLFRKMNAWGIDAEVFDKIIYKNADLIVIHEFEEGRVYKVTCEKFIDKAKYLHFKPHRLQLFLPIEHFEICD